MTRYGNLRKIDNEGHFQPFPGVTVISNAIDFNQKFCKAIYQCLNQSPTLREYYALLPYESYHMTAFGVCTKMWDGGSDWDDYIERSQLFFQELSVTLNKNKETAVIGINDLIIEDSIHLSVHLSTSERDFIYSLAEAFGLVKNVPAEFHITLAYQYKSLRTEVIERIKSEIEDNITKVLRSCPLICLAPAKLCYFEDMTAFIPWDGRHNPFIPSLPVTPCGIIRTASSPNLTGLTEFNRCSPDFPRLGSVLSPSRSSPCLFEMSSTTELTRSKAGSPIKNIHGWFNRQANQIGSDMDQSCLDNVSETKVNEPVKNTSLQVLR